MTRAWLVALALPAGCSPTPEDLGPFAIHLALDTTSEGSLCRSARCQDYGMSCGAVLSTRIRDTENGDVLVANSCEEVPPSATLCGLSGPPSQTFFNIPPHRLRIEVAAWRRDVLTPNPGQALSCPDGDLFTLQGTVRPDFAPQPAFAGAAYFDAGSEDKVAEIRLSCSDPDQLDLGECGLTRTTLVRVGVEDIETALDITSRQAQNLTVGVAEPRPMPDGQGGTRVVIDGGDTIALSLVDGPVPSFANEVEGPFGETMCAVIVDLTPQSTAAVGCGTFPPGESPIDLRGVLVAKSTLDQILAAMDRTSFPPDGLVVGRVVDHTGAPLSQVAVTPSSGTVEYLSPDRSALIGAETSSSGLFIARDVPFGSTWTAIHSVDGRREEGELRAGLVSGKVTPLIIRMQAP
ncbi:MAG TPA: hypothetical protein VKZ63_15700 [Kofleriaceae bacterium]|nr:hypothetical protein [Kofleriaceae bacterium]